jgi:hypothetical protein
LSLEVTLSPRSFIKDFLVEFTDVEEEVIIKGIE